MRTLPSYLEYEIDLRDLPAPAPMQRALAAADCLLPGAAVCVLTPAVPLPLLDALAGRGLHYCVSPLPGGGARVHIMRFEDDASCA